MIMFGQFLRCLVSPKAVGPRRFSVSPVSRSASSVKKDAAALQRLMKTDFISLGLFVFGWSMPIYTIYHVRSDYQMSE